MEVEIKRDGLVLRGTVEKPKGAEKCPVVVMYHGFMSCRKKEPDHQFTQLAQACVDNGLGVVRFDFDGHGESDGEFKDMNILSELLDASKILTYACSLDFADDIYILGHSMGAVVGGMTAGYYRDRVKKLVLLSPAATMKEDALVGSCFGVKYDEYNVPDILPLKDGNTTREVGGMLFRTLKTLPIYETTSMFRGKTLIIHGSADEAVGVIGARRYKEWMPTNTELVIIEGESHGLNSFAFDEVTDRVVKFLTDK